MARWYPVYLQLPWRIRSHGTKRDVFFACISGWIFYGLDVGKYIPGNHGFLLLQKMTLGSKQKCVHVPYFFSSCLGKSAYFLFAPTLFLGRVNRPILFTVPSSAPFLQPPICSMALLVQAMPNSLRKGWAAMGRAPASFGDFSFFFWYGDTRNSSKITTISPITIAWKQKKQNLKFCCFNPHLCNPVAWVCNWWWWMWSFNTLRHIIQTMVDLHQYMFQTTPSHVGPVVGGSSQGEVSQVSFKLRFTEKGTGHPITEKQKVSINHVKGSIILSRVSNPPACKYNVLKTSRYIC